MVVGFVGFLRVGTGFALGFPVGSFGLIGGLLPNTF